MLGSMFTESFVLAKHVALSFKPLYYLILTASHEEETSEAQKDLILVILAISDTCSSI